MSEADMCQRLIMLTIERDDAREALADIVDGWVCMVETRPTHDDTTCGRPAVAVIEDGTWITVCDGCLEDMMTIPQKRFVRI